MNKKYKKNETPYAVLISKAELTTTAKRAVVAEMIMLGKKQKDIVPELMERWNLDHKAAWSMWRQGYSFMYLTSEATKDEVRNLQLARLEELFQLAEEDMELARKDYYNVQMKNIDTVAKVAGLYDKQETTGQSNEINFNLTIPNKNSMA